MNTRKSSFILIAIITAIFFTACSKSNSGNITPTVTNLAGSYKLKSDVWSSGGISMNIYDSLDACEKDNVVKLNSDLTLNFIDAGVVCSPAENSNGTWYLSNDSLYFTGSDINAAKIQSFNGSILILSGHPSTDPTVNAVSTFQKQ